ncbi:MAG TPA: adenylosuccinate synthase [Phycisphaerales bacterium]|nr:adenylosuccinate synthase [Phycisphaerales bacterium]
MACKNVCVVGLQWGDEGKGKIVDAVAGVSRYVARYCGGANAGHTVVVGAEKFALHLIPCGIFRPGVVNVIGNGVAFDPPVARKEIEGLRARGVEAGERNLRISACAQVVMPWHRLQDQLSEQSLGGAKIGTTARGIGPCYSDKANRSTAIRVSDLRDPDRLRDKVRMISDIKSRIFGALYGAEPLDGKQIAEEFVEHGRVLAPMIANTGEILRRASAAGERILFEGGQGTMLDIDHGTYPFVTSSSVSACGVPSGTGVPPSAVGHVIGLVKAYTTRVGAGPFPAEQDNDIGNYIRQRGHEYGTTTGRPRRCGWLDLFLVKYTADLSGVHEIALGLLDVLTGLDELKICTGYRVGAKAVEAFDPNELAQAECVYETLPGWKEDISACRRFADLPGAAQAYVTRIEQYLGRQVGSIGVGPEREMLIRHHTGVEELR